MSPEAIIRSLLTDDQRHTMNLFSLILSGGNPFFRTDESIYVIAQSDEKSPLWAWFDPAMTQSALREAADILTQRLGLNPSLTITTPPENSGPVLEQVFDLYGRQPQPGMTLNVYVCRRVTAPRVSGYMLRPSAEHKPVIARLLVQMVRDADGQSIPQSAADRFAEAAVGSDSLFLWQDGEVCSMAMIASRDQETARINTVVTKRSRRGHGYAGMLVAEMSRLLLGQGLLPLLYADASNPASNRAYQKIGFEQVGRVTEYRWK